MGRLVRYFWLAPVAVVLATGLAQPHPAIAQPWTDLNLTVLPFGYDADVKPGQDNRFFLDIRNAGTRAVGSVRLSSEHPSGWTVEFNPAEVPAIGPGNAVTVDVIVRPPRSASGGQNQITLIATAGDIRKVQIMTVDVKMASYWLWVVAAVAVVIVAVFVVVYLRMGRRVQTVG